MMWAWMAVGMYAAQLVLLRFVARSVRPMELFFVACALGWILAVAILVASLVSEVAVPIPHADVLPFVIGAEAFGWASFFALCAALRSTAVAPVSVTQDFAPALATVSAWMLFGERLSWMQLAGCGIVLVGVLLVQYRVWNGGM